MRNLCKRDSVSGESAEESFRVPLLTKHSDMDLDWEMVAVVRDDHDMNMTWKPSSVSYKSTSLKIWLQK